MGLRVLECCEEAAAWMRGGGLRGARGVAAGDQGGLRVRKGRRDHHRPAFDWLWSK
jgi:hypothetical protein